ncbi:4Fe-4S single cluster domain-containing protein [Spiroplasma endosymbiont of Aspidapion aeneum]|uniref:4Fe-4S single cluster domain-containing protein n=1 Tax=Spiroplasma endosymbiont of Aspidapion aeneum TaxID=3066276 RepID=UPI00313D80D9
MKINIAKFLTCSEIEGPGKRFVIWVQGCLIGCKGCQNKSMLDLSEKLFVEVRVLFNEIKKSKKKNKIIGVTILGGEPFLQPEGLYELVDLCSKENLDVICFTGYIYEKLKDEYENILNNIDILIDGPFILSKLDHKRRLIGSTNQRVINISAKYTNSSYFNEPHSKIEIQLFRDRVNLNGGGEEFQTLVNQLFLTNKD